MTLWIVSVESKLKIPIPECFIPERGGHIFALRKIKMRTLESRFRTSWTREIKETETTAVSYTHLDVYKRQGQFCHILRHTA